MVNIQEKLDQGYIQSKVVVELIGKPKEHIEKTLKQYLEHIKSKTEIIVLREDFAEAKAVEGDDQGLFAAFVELEMMTKDLPSLIGFCFDYMPSSIDIMYPEEFKMSARNLNGIMNDLQGKLHKLDMGAKQLSNENQFLKKNAYFLATNLVSVLIKGGANSLEELSLLSGMTEKDMKEFLDKLIKQNFVAQEGESYKWIKTDGKREE